MVTFLEEFPRPRTSKFWWQKTLIHGLGRTCRDQMQVQEYEEDHGVDDDKTLRLQRSTWSGTSQAALTKYRFG